MTPPADQIIWMVVGGFCTIIICVGSLTTLHRIDVGLEILTFLRRHGPMDSFNLGQVHKVGPWTLYPVLHGLERAGYATSWDVPGDLENRGGRPRRFYKITDAGRIRLADENR